MTDRQPVAQGRTRTLSYQRDFRSTEIAVASGPQPANDNDDFMLGLGVRYFNADGITGNLEWNRRLGREDFLNLTIRADF